MSSSPMSDEGVSRVGSQMPSSASEVSGPLAKFEHSVSLLTWAHNQADLVETFIPRATELLDQAVEDWEIVFVDNCSTDRTPLLLRSLSAQEPRLRTFRQMRQVGTGQAYRSALAQARKGFYFWQTPDWPHDLTKLRSILELLKHFDAIKGIQPERSTTAGAIVSQLMFGATLRDSSSICFMATKRARALGLTSRTSFIHSEVLLRNDLEGRRVIELPVRAIHPPRPPHETFAALRDALSYLMKPATWRPILNSQLRGKSITRTSQLDSLKPDVAELVRPILAD